MKRNDWLLISAIVCITFIGFGFHFFSSSKEAGYITITVDGEEEGMYSLSEDQTIDINKGTNTLIIKDGQADMVKASCKDKVCVHQKAISKNHQSIICLPNKVVVEVKNSKDSGIDAVVN